MGSASQQTRACWGAGQAHLEGTPVGLASRREEQDRASCGRGGEGGIPPGVSLPSKNKEAASPAEGGRQKMGGGTGGQPPR